MRITTYYVQYIDVEENVFLRQNNFEFFVMFEVEEAVHHLVIAENDRQQSFKTFNPIKLIEKKDRLIFKAEFIFKDKLKCIDSSCVPSEVTIDIAREIWNELNEIGFRKIELTSGNDKS
jgi:hypothetical protein